MRADADLKFVQRSCQRRLDTDVQCVNSQREMQRRSVARPSQMSPVYALLLDVVSCLGFSVKQQRRRRLNSALISVSLAFHLSSTTAVNYSALSISNVDMGLYQTMSIVLLHNVNTLSKLPHTALTHCSPSYSNRGCTKHITCF